MGKLYLHALVPLFLLLGTTGETLAAPDPADGEPITTDGITATTEGITTTTDDITIITEASDRAHETDEGHSTGIAREDMPPVAPMIPTGCNPAMDLISSDPQFSIFRTAIEETGLDSVFGNLRLRATVLLPTNEAIKNTFDATGVSPEELLTEYVKLERLVRNHVLPMYNLGYEDMQEWGGCFDSMVEGSCIRVELDEAGEVRLGSDGTVGIDEDMRDMGGDCPTTMHAIDGLLLVDIILLASIAIAFAKQSFYDLLHVHQGADDATIKRSYRKLALQLHPDKVQGDENEKKAAADKFAEVSHAYEVLTDPEKRKIYDRYGEEGLNNMGQGGHAHPGDIFSQFFGGFGGFPFGGGFQEEQTPKGQDVHVGVDVTLEDLYVGKEVHVTRDKHVLKPAPGKRECNCKQKMITRQIGPGMFQQTPIRECEKCDNVRLERQKDELTVHVEPGMADGQEIVFFEEGEPIVDGEQGDLVFHVQVRPHAVFDRRGADLVMTLGVTLTEALTGFEKKLRHLDGHEVVLARADVTRPGDVMVVEGEGMPVSGGAGKGRLFVHVQVRFPDKPLDAKEVGEVRRVFDVEERAWGAVQSVVEGKDVVYPEESPEKKKDEL